MDDEVLGAVVAGDSGGAVDLGAVALPVVEGEGQGRPVGTLGGEGHAHRRVETARQDHQLLVHGPPSRGAAGSTEASVVSHKRNASSDGLASSRWAASNV